MESSVENTRATRSMIRLLLEKENPSILEKKAADVPISLHFPATILYDLFSAIDRKNIETCRYASKSWRNTIEIYSNILPQGTIPRFDFMNAIDGDPKNKAEPFKLYLDYEYDHGHPVIPEESSMYFLNNVVKKCKIHVNYYEIGKNV